MTILREAHGEGEDSVILTKAEVYGRGTAFTVILSSDRTAHTLVSFMRIAGPEAGAKEIAEILEDASTSFEEACDFMGLAEVEG